MMNRREALRAVSFLMGGAVLGAEFFLSGCSTKNEERPTADKALTADDISLLDEIGDTIIPETDTPGAKAVGIGAFMAMMVEDAYEPAAQQEFKKGLIKIREDFQDLYQHTFLEGKPEERHQFLSKLNNEFLTNNQIKTDQEPEHYFKMMKELTLLGYFSSEIGATKALRYIEVPGRYDGCVPYEKGMKAWAT